MKPTIVPAVITQDRELLWRLPNVRMGDHLANPHSRIGALLFYPPEYRSRRETTTLAHERFLLDADTAYHVARHSAPPRPRPEPPAWSWEPQQGPPPDVLYATHLHAFVPYQDIKRALWTIEIWLEEVIGPAQ